MKNIQCEYSFYYKTVIDAIKIFRNIKKKKMLSYYLFLPNIWTIVWFVFYIFSYTFFNSKIPQ